jgi:hypothetical protein
MLVMLAAEDPMGFWDSYGMLTLAQISLDLLSGLSGPPGWAAFCRSWCFCNMKA